MLQVIFTDTWNYNYFTGFSSHSDKIHNKMTGVWCGNKDTEELNLWAEVVLCVIDQSIDHIKAQEDMSGSIHDSLTTHHRTQRYNQALAHRHSGQQVVTLVNYSLTSFTESHQYYILSYDLCWCHAGDHVSTVDLFWSTCVTSCWTTSELKHTLVSFLIKTFHYTQYERTSQTSEKPWRRGHYWSH